MHKAIILDVFGTLISTGNGSLEATQKILNKVGSRADPKEFYIQWKKLYHELGTCKNGFITEKEIFQTGLKILYERYQIQSNYLSDVNIMLDSRYNRKAFDDVASALKILKKKYKLIIGSNTDNDPLMKNLEDNNIEVDSIFTSEDLLYYKPNKMFYSLILEKINLLPSEILFVGDSLIDDIYGPQQIGIKTVLIDRKGTYCNETKGEQPDFIVKSLVDIWDKVCLLD